VNNKFLIENILQSIGFHFLNSVPIYNSVLCIVNVKIPIYRELFGANFNKFPLNKHDILAESHELLITK